MSHYAIMGESSACVTGEQERALFAVMCMKKAFPSLLSACKCCQELYGLRGLCSDTAEELTVPCPFKNSCGDLDILNNRGTEADVRCVNVSILIVPPLGCHLSQ